ncbi:TPA: RNA-directed DNA polymerase, partial [Staphylococcus pseudintermedius]
LDNEIDVKGKPLNKMINIIKFEKGELERNLYVNLVENLYLTTIPKTKEKNESEIEDLFNEETLNKGIEGRPFTKKDNYNIKEYCGKDEFSKYVYNNYANIDFKKFHPL